MTEPISGSWALRLPDDVEAISERTRLLQWNGQQRRYLNSYSPSAAFKPPTGPPALPPRSSSAIVSSTPQKSSKFLDIEDLRRRTAEQAVLEDATFVENENAAGIMVLRSIANSALQSTAVLGSYFFIESGGRLITPRCFKFHVSNADSYSKVMLPEYFCFATTYCFWTFPVICAFGVVIIFLKGLLDKRLFFECLLNRIFLVQRRGSYLRSPTFWFLSAYGLSGLCSVYFVNWNSSFIESHDVDVAFGLMVYLSATCAFVFVICSQWSSSRGILPLPTFVQQDCAAAIALLSECKFVDEHQFRRAFEVVEDLMERENAKVNRLLKPVNMRYTFDLKTAELMRLILDMHEEHTQYEPANTWNQVYYHLKLCQVYWVTRVLYFPHLNDDRSGRFKFWARFHYAFTLFAALLFAYTLFYLTNEFLVFQHAIHPVIRPSSPESDFSDLVNKTTSKVRDVVKGMKRG